MNKKVEIAPDNTVLVVITPVVFNRTQTHPTMNRTCSQLCNGPGYFLCFDN